MDKIVDRSEIEIELSPRMKKKMIHRLRKMMSSRIKIVDRSEIEIGVSPRMKKEIYI